MCLRTGLHGWRLHKRYLGFSSHLTIRKFGDRLFHLKCLVLSTCIYFLVEDKEGSAVSCEKNLRKRQGRGVGGMLATGGKTFIEKGIASLPLSAMETPMNPSCNAIQPVTRRGYCFWRCDIFPLVQRKTWLNCCGGFPARRTWKLVISRFFFLYGTAKKSTSFMAHVLRYFFCSLALLFRYSYGLRSENPR